MKTPRLFLRRPKVCCCTDCCRAIPARAQLRALDRRQLQAGISRANFDISSAGPNGRAPRRIGP